MNLNELRDKAYKTACEHGFHDQELSNNHFLCLVISELMEAVEADRKGRRANVDRYNKKIANSRICQGLDSDIPKERGYEVAYNETIKGSIEEELADAVIRLLDLAGFRGIDLDEDAFDEETISEYSATYCNKSFTESIFHIIKFITSNNEVFIRSCVVPEMLLLEIFGLAKYLSIDLMWHIEQKMKYNELREKMHGKKY
jgi:NTP pyrophosphatase (non-canonical NTP hydrolase)|nr:MAG TPA: NTP-PPase-like protein [Caudoviricetes sp.]